MPENIHARGGVSVHSSVDGHLTLAPSLSCCESCCNESLCTYLCAYISVHVDLGLSGKQPGEAELGHMADPLLNF